MIRIYIFFIFLVFTICLNNVNAVSHKNFFTISHANAPTAWKSNQQRKFAYVDLARNKDKEGKRNLLDGNARKQKCPLRKVSFAGLMGVSGLSIPLFLATYMIYNKIKNDNQNLNVSEKILGKYLYKHEKNLQLGNHYDEEKPYNIFYIISSVYNNILALINFYMNVKKVGTKNSTNEYTILFFHSYNVDKFLHARNIKTYVERLKEIYKDINKKNNVNVVYVPLDSKLLFNIKHFSTMNNWYSILFHDKKHILKLIKNYNIMNIPTMVLLDKNMNIINDNINYLLLYESKHFPYKNVNHLTYINSLYDKNNKKHDFKKLNSDYVLFYFNNDKENKGDIQSLLKVKKKLASQNVKIDIIFVKDMEKMKSKKDGKEDAKVDEKKVSNQSDNDKSLSSSNKKEEKLEEGKKDPTGEEHTPIRSSSQYSREEDQMENYIDDVYYLGEQENNAIYKLLLYDMFDVTFKPVCILVNKKGNIIIKYIHVEKKENEIASFILNNHKSLKEEVNEKNYMFKYDNISNLTNLNVFAPIFILFSEKLDFDLLKQYNELIGEYNNNRKGKKINFYFLLNNDKKYEALKKLCTVNSTTEVVILDLFNQKMFKDKVNNLDIIQNINGKGVINKDKFFTFVNKYYSDDLYASTIVLSREA
ncbi:thioredoxin-like protein [Plasmodium gonderi]|uniref:Thioredoxin-like protein n=1 Tax=Plasmodium gonderi TaxID=77519 RepID=A0A1Y1JKI2_PLAGO|nr:thioredoxin-like protein [Plasmodium gonderi]GAW83029.1 thioredoxin-like protein [Plasmodium gonderi]